MIDPIANPVVRSWPRFLALSDWHGGGIGRANDGRKHAPLLRVLLQRCVEIDLPVLFLGDMFEEWQFDPIEILIASSLTMLPAMELGRRGKLVYATGNHDDDSLTLGTLVPWIGPAARIDTGAGVWWGEHGHRLDRYNRKPGLLHEIGLRIVRKLEDRWPGIDSLDRWRPARERRAQDGSKDSLAVEARHLLASGFAGVLMGHTHREGVWMLDGKPYGNTGAWTEDRRPAAILVDGAVPRLVRFDSMADVRKIF